jgi:ubiquinone/menaquinone biosynthesis C-methylase UbiE
MPEAAHNPPDGIIGVFSRAAPTYDRIGPPIFAHFGRRLVELAQLTAGAHVLDVATGRGAVLFPAATQVEPSGRVIGIDLSTEMVRETAAAVRSVGWQQIDVQHMSAQELRFPEASFDWVLCGFALWFFPQPHRALQEFCRVLKPGGRVGLTTWAEDCPFIRWCQNVLRPYAPPQASPGQAPPRFDTPARLEAALQQAGFTQIHTMSEDGDFIYTQEEEWWTSLWSGAIRRQLEAMTAPVLAQAKTEACQQVQVFKQADGIHTLWRVLFALGAKSEH